MRTEPHRSITKARVDYRFGDADARAKLALAFEDLGLQVHAIPVPAMLERTLPHCNATDAAYFRHNLAAVTPATEAWAVTWTEGEDPRVETHIAIAPADDQLFRDNVSFQCAHELLEMFRGLMEQAMRIQASQPVEGEFVAVER